MLAWAARLDFLARMLSDPTRRGALLLGAKALAATLVSGCGSEQRPSLRDSAIQPDPRGSIAPAQLGPPMVEAHHGGPFRLKFAPHFGLFRDSAGADPVAQIEFGAAQGFRAWEDNSLPERSAATKRRIAEALKAHQIEMGVFTIGSSAGYVRPSIVTGKKEETDRFLDEIRSRIELAHLVGAKWVMVNPGLADLELSRNHQIAHVIDAMRAAVEVVRPAGLIMVLEPTNSTGRTPRLLDSMDSGYLICRAVDSPNLKLLFDVYQQQVMRGNIINEIDAYWDEIDYIQIGDHPGRNEPMTGEINYLNVLRHLHAKGYDGIIGMEHQARGGSAAGEQAMIAAYRALDAAVAG